MGRPDRIHFNCPECGAAVRAPLERAGLRARCGNCGAKVLVPAAAAGRAPKPAAAEPLPLDDTPLDALPLDDDPPSPPARPRRPAPERTTRGPAPRRPRDDGPPPRRRDAEEDGDEDAPEGSAGRQLWVWAAALVLLLVVGGGLGFMILSTMKKRPRPDDPPPEAAAPAARPDDPAPPAAARPDLAAQDLVGEWVDGSLTLVVEPDGRCRCVKTVFIGGGDSMITSVAASLEVKDAQLLLRTSGTTIGDGFVVPRVVIEAETWAVRRGEEPDRLVLDPAGDDKGKPRTRTLTRRAAGRPDPGRPVAKEAPPKKAGPDPAADERDLKLLQGRWRPRKVYYEDERGALTEASAVLGGTITVDGKSFTQEVLDPSGKIELAKGTITRLDAAKSPAEFDLTYDSGPGRGTTLRVVYRVTETSFVFVLCPPGVAPPAEVRLTAPRQLLHECVRPR